MQSKNVVLVHDRETWYLKLENTIIPVEVEAKIIFSASETFAVTTLLMSLILAVN